MLEENKTVNRDKGSSQLSDTFIRACNRLFADTLAATGTEQYHFFIHIQEPTGDSVPVHPKLLYTIIFEYCVLYGALVVTLWTCYGALQIVVLFFNPQYSVPEGGKKIEKVLN